MKKLLVLLMTIIFLSANSYVYAAAKDSEPAVSADSAVLMDATTGEVLYAKNMDTAYPPASTTKIMTALLTLENCKLDDIVTVGKNPPLADGSKIYLFEGEQISVKDLLYALLLSSANDAAEALAEHISGSIDKFAEEMNKRAKELGCENTHFVNPNGLYNKEHKISAKDLALIMRELVKHPEFREISLTNSYIISPTNKQAKKRPLWNENKLVQKGSVYYYEGIEGGKTGYTVDSQHSYVASATRNGQRLIVALVHDSKKTFFKDSRALLDYGFKNFELSRYYAKGDLVTTYTNGDLQIPLLAADDLYFVKEKGSSDTPQYSLINADLSTKSFKRGDPIMEATVTFQGKSLGTLQLASGEDHEIKPLLQQTITETPKSTRYSIYFIFAAVFTIIFAFALRKFKRKRLR